MSDKLLEKQYQEIIMPKIARKTAKTLSIAAVRELVAASDDHNWDSPFGWATPLETWPFRKLPPQILLDTPVLDWLLRKPNQLSHNALRLLNECEDGCLVSSVSWLEWAELLRRGDYQLRGNFQDFTTKLTEALRLQVVEIPVEALRIYTELPPVLAERRLGNVVSRKILHNDRHDLLLAAHAIALKVPFLSPHAVFGNYGKAGLKWVW